MSRLAISTLCIGLILSGCNLPRQTSPSIPIDTEISSPTHNSVYLPVLFKGAPILYPQLEPEPASQIRLTTSPPPTPTQLSINEPGTVIETEPGDSRPAAMPLLSDDQVVNILLAGSDIRSGTSFRTDALIIASLRPSANLVTLISIPRDLYVYIPDWTMQRINTAYLHGEKEGYPGGGPALLAATILYNLGILIDHVALVDFDNFRQIIDTLGGLDIPLTCSFTDWHIIDPNKSPEKEKNWELITIGPGLVHMDGDLALWYARSRLRSNDFDRGRRQQEILRAIYTRSMQINLVPQIPELYGQLKDMVATDMVLEDILELTPMVLHLSAPRIRSFYLNKDYVKSWRTPEGAAVLLPKPHKVKELVAEAMAPPDPDQENDLRTTIEIWNGSSNPSWNILAAERFNYAGFETRLRRADRSDYPRTLLYDFTLEQDQDRALTVLSLLGLPAKRLRPQPDPNARVDYRLILGADYDPCFNPAEISR